MKLLKKANGNRPVTKNEKRLMIAAGEVAYGDFLTAMGFDWKADPNTKLTPYRYAKSWVEDLISGSLGKEPDITAFPSDGYDGIVLQKDIPFNSMCSHHNREIKGKVHIAYIPGKSGMVVGLSKMNRMVDFYSRRPQIQEGMTMQIYQKMNKVLKKNKGIAIIVEAVHGCVSCRGVRHEGAAMITSKLTGYFFDNKLGTRVELFNLIANHK